MIDTIVLDDNKEYIIVEELVINNVLYTMFANVNDGSDICFRKTLVLEDGKEYYVGLDDQNEFDLVVLHFNKKILS